MSAAQASSGAIAKNLSRQDADHMRLTFVSGGGHYAIEILSVREVLGALPTTRVPGNRSELKGVANLRGRIVPVLHFSSLVGSVPVTNDENHRAGTIIVIVDDQEVGVAVDGIRGVVPISTGAVRDLPNIEIAFDRKFASGAIIVQETLHIMLSLDEMIANTGILKPASTDEV